jgi:hypothetical protein
MIPDPKNQGSSSRPNISQYYICSQCAGRQRKLEIWGNFAATYLKNLQTSFFKFDWIIAFDFRKVLGQLTQIWLEP